jgi:hypothetical protein
MPTLEIDTTDVDPEVVEDLCDYLFQVFSQELDEGTTLPELLLSVGTVITHMSKQDSETQH